MTKLSSIFPIYAAGLGIDINGMIEKECNKAKYRAADRQASYREKEEARKAEFNKRFEKR